MHDHILFHSWSASEPFVVDDLPMLNSMLHKLQPRRFVGGILQHKASSESFMLISFLEWFSQILGMPCNFNLYSCSILGAVQFVLLLIWRPWV